MKLRKDCSAAEWQRYLILVSDSWQAVHDSRVYLEVAREGESNSSIRVEMGREIVRLQLEEGIMEAKERAARSNQQAFNPPTKARVDEAQALADKIDEEIAKNAKWEAVVGLATEALVRFNAVHPPN